MPLNFLSTLLLVACSIGVARAVTFDLPPEGEDVVGQIFTLTTRYEETFSDIARIYDIGYRQMVAANPDVDPWLPGEGSEVVIPQQYVLPPGPRKGLVINLAELRLYYFPEDRPVVITYPIGIGREGWSTPTGETQVIGKKKDPSWTVPESILEEHEAEGDPLPPVVPPGPENPLGNRAIYLGMNGYLLHGTNKPYGVGMRVSHGCIRLYPENVERFFEEIEIGVPVRIVDKPFKAGWLKGELFIQVHPPLAEYVEQRGHNYTELVDAVISKLEQDERRPDWDQLYTIIEQKTGIPMPLFLWQGKAVADGNH
ncbi:MAG: L,D-transpeptidase [gamma proteobacterium symbiont of Ctena orbiculata]|uniref:L,D-transpeptidase family protein n=1 Tax=Candidatus Thiodiazotropha taylori TaxID=2792791 RepID=A0A944QTC4_9GAMM|nr:L,D-transpeptidase family protein [Candidatus Thiodiazotropha taylori]PUB89944.1 MAG: L,D-transpeptidase [gamma proteobacterium symbiont of Ctena orbiculata]MBT2988937.1 L,D-transpeptidase family protein [Candidatus Thiodiazotropha taylori]MBT2996417.1 L,D-transpeptidase family protein [Candidatus Thiodiazotropha taylori]MBT3000149.1 L,D-transpeptidase family protein [Candidatus Thiodiazotropha taylori]